MIFKKFKFYFFFYYIFFLFFWLSIGSTPSYLINLNSNTKEILNFFLNYIPLFISIFILIPLGLKNIIKNIKSRNLYKLQYLFIFFYFFQLIGLIFNNNLDFNFTNSYLAILGLGLTSLMVLVEEFDEKKYFKNFIYISIVILLTLSLILIISKIDTFLFTSDKYFYAYETPGEKFLYQEMPRVTGFSRTLAILVLFFICLIIWKLKSNYLIAVLSIFSFVYVFFIYGMQSRGTIVCFVTVFLILIFFSHDLKFKFKIFFLIFFLMFPTITYEAFLFLKTKKPEVILNLKDTTNNLKDTTNNLKDTTNGNKQLINKHSTGNRIFDLNQTATGRTLLWKEVIENYDLRRIFGYGPQADRFLITSDKGTWLGSNSSNATIYAFASGGYFCLLIMFIIYSRGAYLLFKLFFVNKIFSHNNDIELKISSLFFIFFLIRSIFENSFALFSTDFILTILAITIIENYFDKKNSKELINNS